MLSVEIIQASEAAHLSTDAGHLRTVPLRGERPDAQAGVIDRAGIPRRQLWRRVPGGDRPGGAEHGAAPPRLRVRRRAGTAGPPRQNS